MKEITQLHCLSVQTDTIRLVKQEYLKGNDPSAEVVISCKVGPGIDNFKELSVIVSVKLVLTLQFATRTKQLG